MIHIWSDAPDIPIAAASSAGDAVNRRRTLTIRRLPILISELRSKPLVVLKIFPEFPDPACPPI